MPRQRRAGREAGGLLIIMMIGVAVTSIGLTVATQSWRTTLRRDREEELIFRARQYVSAIMLYRKEHGGQFPMRLEDLYKPGPRRLRYIRKLYKDPLVPDGRWGLLYLMPGGQGVYDARAAQKAQQKAEDEWGGGWTTAGSPAGGAGGLPPGVTPLRLPGGAGVPPPGGGVPGALPPGPIALPPLPQATPPLAPGEEAVSEPPIGWPIVGVISRATGESAEATYKIYKGHERVDEWQFHVFDQGAEMPQVPGGVAPPLGPQFVGPGFGGKGIGGLGGGLQPGGLRGRGPARPGQGGQGGKGNQNWQNQPWQQNPQGQEQQEEQP